ncbi:Pimeloyl-ACP methyl ester carboxylesterase [Goodfellowiella coeruleoviolacea]|uniref:Pimeloyl-ACP methyl ester carboxylesterase n=1 Tax=Goodfellowiella coeruleoviolacea TaxID=334858 RepID=A0AAE3KP46_9PSEU|nr:Pimeloyl-ACP methyl ester carboxylesterase [Goodfellowiella coeruleoviolacea]
MPARVPTEHLVDHDGVELAVRDHGGDGPPVLLLHGAGRTLADWAAVAPLLTPQHRVLAMDLRAHGRSGSGPWTLPAVVGDVEAVLAALGATHAVLVGHSLGGMVAVQYAADHPGTPAVVNLDGHGMGRPEQYAGLDADYVTGRLAEIRAMAERAAGRLLRPADVDALLAQQTATGQALGIPGELLAAGLRRALAQRPDGHLCLRPEPEPAAQMQAVVHELDVFPLYRSTRTPVLVCRAGRANPSTPGLPWVDELWAAYARGLDRDLTELAATHPHITVEVVDAAHAMHLERPDEIARHIRTFTARHCRPRADSDAPVGRDR